MDAEKPRHAAYRFDRFILDLSRGTLLAADGTELPLRPKSFALLQFLVENAGRLLDRDAIMAAVWPGVFVSDDSITQCIRDIRRALGDESQNLLRTVQRRGYLLAVEVSRADSVLPATGPEPEPAHAEHERIEDEFPEDAEPSEPAAPSLSPERRHLTVLFCDFAGSGREQPDDPEDLGSTMRVYRERCTVAIARCGGHVASYAGDGVLAFFGYPQAREDAAERSVRAGLAIIEATDELKPALDVRIGIATGLVVNDQAGGRAQEQVAVGKPLNLASALHAIAAPGTVVIADTTQRLLGSLFALEDLGRHTLKGFDMPVRAWQVTGEGPAEDRFEALRGASLTPLVGRTQELTLLLDRWEQAKEGDGQAVLLVGEPGIGKSRLVRALRDRVADDPHMFLGCYCSPHRVDSPLQPVIAYLERAANFMHGDGAGEKLTKLQTMMASTNDNVAELTPLMASLLSIPSEGRYEPLNMSPQLQRDRTLEALAAQMAVFAEQQPVLLVWEDVHWADPSSLELLGLVIGRLQGLRVLLVITFRPEFAPPWRGHTHLTGLTLNRLSRRRCSELVASLAGGKPLPDVVLDQIAAKADGMPLFAEEVTKAVLESGLLREEADGYALAGPLSAPAIPATLQDSLMARLDRLTPAKEVAQVAAVIGREFPRALLAAIVSRMDELDEALDQLITAELVFRRGVTPHVTYVFKHALVRDVAYASLLKSKRRQLHARIAQVLEEQFAQTVEAEPDVLARHWAEAGVAEKAASYRLKAGQRALAHSATAEALAQLTMGRELLQTLPEGETRHHSELDLQIALGAALSAAKGYAAQETTQAYVRARELCDKLREERRLLPVLLGLWGSYNARDELGAARKAAEQLLKLAEQKQDPTASILGHRALGTTLFGLGEFTAARLHLERMLELDSPSTRLSFSRLPFDPCISGRAWLALTLSVLGYPEQAFAQSDEAIAEAVRLKHHNTMSIVFGLRCSLGQFLRDHRDVAKHAENLRTLAAEQGFAYWAGLATYFRGWAQGRAGELQPGISEMRRGLAACQTTGAQAYVPYNLALLADMCRTANDTTEARKVLDEALDQLGKTEALYCEAELLCIDGELKLALSRRNQDAAEALFQRGVEIARQQNAKIVELRAAICLAKALSARGKTREAHDALAPTYGWFSEGFGTAHLQEAKQLLDTLQGENRVSSGVKDRALQGIRVLDLTQFLSGPFATQILADLGADIIKLEPPQGDPIRAVPPHFVGEDSVYYLCINRNKRTVAVDMKVAEGRELVKRLALASDIVMENFRPGVLERLGLSADALRKEKPSLIWCSISGFGQDGPYRTKPAYDMIVQALSGGMSLTGEEGGAPVRAGIPIADLGAGLYSTVAVLAALNRRHATGKGETIDISMLDCQAAMLCYQAAYHMHSGVVPGRQGRGHESIPTYRSFVCKDGVSVVITANTERMWQGLVRVLKREELLADPRFTTNKERLAHREALWPILNEAFRARNAEEWLPLLEAEEIPVGVVNTLDRVVSDPQIRHRNMVLQLEGADGKRSGVMGNPIKFKDADEESGNYPRELGADTASVLREILNLSNMELTDLIRLKAIVAKDFTK